MSPATTSNRAGGVMSSSTNHNQHIIDFNPTPKQDEAWKILEDKETNVLYYGGAALMWAAEKHILLVLGQ